jgi:hypothetical protein
MYELRATKVSDRLTMIELERRFAPCSMWCRFCPRTAAGDPRDLPVPDAATQLRLRRTFGRLVLQHRTPDVFLWSDDLLRYPDLLSWLDLLKREGRRAHVVTPGLALADRAFAERFVGYDLRFDLTVHALDEPTFTRMCGNPDAHDLVFRAIENLRDLGIEHLLAVTVTDVNVGVLDATLEGLVRRYGPDRLFVRAFYPDALQGPPGYEDQFPAFDELQRRIGHLAGLGLPGLPAITLSNVPPCQLRPELFAGVPVFLSADHNTHRAGDLEACATCPAAPGCARVHPAYGRTHPVREPDVAYVAEVLARLERQERPHQATPG